MQRVSHVPWWDYLKLFKSCPFKADVIISNANLAEMNLICLRYVLRLSRQMLADSPIGLFIFSNFGSPHMSSAETVEHEFRQAGYRQVLDANVYALEDVRISTTLIEILESEIPLFAPDGGGKTFGPREFITLDDGLSDEYQFNAFASDWPSMDE